MENKDMKKVALLQTVYSFGRSRVMLLGFVDREIQTLTVPSAPSYSGKGPWTERTWTFVELLGRRWSPERCSFWSRTEGTESEIMSVTLGQHDEEPRDVYQDPDLFLGLQP